MSPRILSAVVAALIFAPSSAHYMWQHEAVSSDGGAIVAMTFAEGGGVDHAESEEFAQRLADAGVVASVLSKDMGADLELEVDGKFVVGKVPEAYGRRFATEGYVEWGVYSGYGEHTIPPVLVFEHTSASHMEHRLSPSSLPWKNGFRLELEGTFESGKCPEKQKKELCIAARAVWDDAALPGADVLFTHGTDVVFSHSEGGGTTVTTDSDGMAYLAVPWSDLRIFGRINHVINEGGETEDGEHYDSISHWSTASYEFSKTRMNLDGEEMPFFPQEYYHHGEGKDSYYHGRYSHHDGSDDGSHSHHDGSHYHQDGSHSHHYNGIHSHWEEGWRHGSYGHHEIDYDTGDFVRRYIGYFLVAVASFAAGSLFGFNVRRGKKDGMPSYAAVCREDPACVTAVVA